MGFRGFNSGALQGQVFALYSRLKSRAITLYRQNPVLFGLAAFAISALLLWAVALLLQGFWHLVTAPFTFFSDSAGFAINQTLLPYSESSSYGRAFMVGLLNTLLVSGLAIIFATIVGFIVGIARLSPNWLVAKLAMAYVEIIRNIPLLLQLFFWYFAVLRTLPHPKNSHALLDSFFLNKRGLFLPKAVFDPAMIWVGLAVLASVTAAFLLHRKNRLNHIATGHRLDFFWRWVAAISLFPVAVFLLLGLPLHLEYPALGRFNLRGGMQVLPEFIALLLALSLYTAGYIAEIIRSGILAVNQGQKEAAAALGLSRSQSLKLVVVPQAMRIIIPPLTNQYMNTIKNSSLAVAIAYPDLVHVTMGAMLSQTGKAVELVMLVMLVYLSLSLLTSLFMGWFDRKMQLVER